VGITPHAARWKCGYMALVSACSWILQSSAFFSEVWLFGGVWDRAPSTVYKHGTITPNGFSTASGSSLMDSRINQVQVLRIFGRKTAL
jgi:hypothetical protein